MDAKPAQVIPNIYVESVETMRSFYMETLGFDHMMGVVGKDGKLDFCIVIREGAQLMIGRAPDQREGAAQKHATPRPLELYIEVSDVDAYHDQLRGKVTVKEALTTQWWGDRNFAVDDPYGYRLWFFKTVKQWDEIQPPAGVTVI
jgi:uncharacterized glyoxalase superfamily protein PhnB